MGQARILFVDDDVPWLGGDLAFYLRETSQRPIDVVTCADVRQALRLLKENGPFDLVVTDLCLGLESGLDIVAAVRKGSVEGNPGTSRKTPIVVWTADPWRCERLAANDNVMVSGKMTSIKNLVDLISSGLDGAPPDARQSDQEP